MTTAKRERINELADLVRDACEISVPATEDDLRGLVSRLGGTYAVKRDCDFEAMIEKTPDGGFAITLSEQFVQNRRKFSVAHELGHLFLHMGFAIDDNTWKSSNQPFKDSARYRLGRNEEEYEANEFAAALLMPKGEFDKVAADSFNSDTGVYEVDKIAARFEVSLHAALTRGRWLGLFPWE